MNSLKYCLEYSLIRTIIFKFCMTVDTNNSWSGFNLGENCVKVKVKVTVNTKISKTSYLNFTSLKLYSNILSLGGHEYLGWHWLRP